MTSDKYWLQRTTTILVLPGKVLLHGKALYDIIIIIVVTVISEIHVHCDRCCASFQEGGRRKH